MRFLNLRLTKKRERECLIAIQRRLALDNVPTAALVGYRELPAAFLAAAAQHFAALCGRVARAKPVRAVAFFVCGLPCPFHRRQNGAIRQTVKRIYTVSKPRTVSCWHFVIRMTKCQQEETGANPVLTRNSNGAFADAKAKLLRNDTGLRPMPFLSLA